MKIKFLGTGNAAGIPNPFCCCKICEMARNGSVKDIRTRSSVLINDDLLIDITPDLSQQLLREKTYFNNLKYILLTHSHLDHFSMLEFTNIRMAQLNNDDIIQVYGHGDTLNMIDVPEGKMYLDSTEYIPNTKNYYNIKECKFYNAFKLGCYEIIAIPSNHSLVKLNKDESDLRQGSNYIIKHKNQVLLYGVDKNVYSESTMNFISEYKFDKIIFDCNDGFFEKYSNHTNIYEINGLLEYLYRFNSIDKETPIYLTHITHKMSHNEFERKLNEFSFNIKVAYDGLEI